MTHPLLDRLSGWQLPAAGAVALLTGVGAARYASQADRGAGPLLIVLQIAVTSSGIGILGEYLGRSYVDTKRRPLWIVDYALNFDDALPSSYALQAKFADAEKRELA